MKRNLDEIVHNAIHKVLNEGNNPLLPEDDPTAIWIHYSQLFHRLSNFMDKRYRKGNMANPITFDELNNLKAMIKSNIDNIERQ